MFVVGTEHLEEQSVFAGYEVALHYLGNAFEAVYNRIAYVGFRYTDTYVCAHIVTECLGVDLEP